MPIRFNVVQVWLSPFFHWKKGCELSAAADDNSTAACKQIENPTFKV